MGCIHITNYTELCLKLCSKRKQLQPLQTTTSLVPWSRSVHPLKPLCVLHGQSKVLLQLVVTLVGRQVHSVEAARMARKRAGSPHRHSGQWVWSPHRRSGQWVWSPHRWSGQWVWSPHGQWATGSPCVCPWQRGRSAISLDTELPRPLTPCAQCACTLSHDVTHTRTHICTHTQTHINTYIHTYSHVHTEVHTYQYMQSCTYRGAHIPCSSANPFMGTLDVPVTNCSNRALISLS